MSEIEEKLIKCLASLEFDMLVKICVENGISKDVALSVATTFFKRNGEVW